MGRPKFAIVLAAYNGIPWIGEQVETILAQQGVDVTIFISVDKSTDGTERWVKDRAGIEPRIVMLPPVGRLGGAGKNFFRLLRDIDLTGFDYLALADQDDLWFKTKLLRAHKIIQAVGVDAYSSNVVAFWPDGRELLVNKSQPQREWDFLFESAGPGCTYVFTNAVARALKGLVQSRWDELDDVWLHDWLFYAYVRASGHSWYIDKRPGLRYRQHDANQIGVNRGWHSLRHRLDKIRSGFARLQCQKVALIAGVDPEAPIMRALFNKGWAGNLFLALRVCKTRRSLGGRMVMFAVCTLNLF